MFPNTSPLPFHCFGTLYYYIYNYIHAVVNGKSGKSYNGFL